jgi:hypothetical protein
MRSNLRARAGAAVAALVAGTAIVAAGQQGQAPTPYPLSPSIRNTGQGVTAAYEGWFYDKDGSVRLLVGYFNRNLKEELDVPIGPNRIEPGGPDQGQPTHFLPGRQYGVFAIKVPKDFGTKQLTWTLVAKGQTNVIPMHLKAGWVVEPVRGCRIEEHAAGAALPALRRRDRGSALGDRVQRRGDRRRADDAHRVGERRAAEGERRAAAAAQPPAPRIGRGLHAAAARRHLEPLSRARHSDVRECQAGGRQGGRRQDRDDGHLQRAG